MGRWAIINGLLAVFIILLGFQIGRIWTRTLKPVEIVARPGTGAQPSPKSEGGGKRKSGEKGGAPKAAESTPVAMITTIADRDLFDPSRAKPTVEATAVAPAPVVQPPQNVSISGVRVLGKDREAFVTDAGQARRVRVGDQVQGYIVKVIKTTEIVLASPAGESVSLSLAVEKGKGGGMPAVGKPPTPGRPGQPPVPPGAPGAPPAGPLSPSAGVQAGSSTAAGIQPPKPAPPRPGAPGAPGMPGAPGAPGVPAVQPMPVPPVPPGGAGAPAGNPNVQIPHQVRDSLERFKEQQRERREMGKQ